MPFTLSVRNALAAALCLVFPSWCAGCEAPDSVLCSTCRATLEPRPLRRVLSSGLQVVSALSFEGEPARVIRACKEDGRTGLARPLGAALAAVLPLVVPPLRGAVPAGASVDVTVVAIPSSRGALRRRGYSVTELLSRRAGCVPRRLLVPAHRAADQRALGRQERAANVAGTLRASRVAAGQRVLLIDDVVTTGATLVEAHRALRLAGAEVIGAATVAATPRRLAGSGESNVEGVVLTASHT